MLADPKHTAWNVATGFVRRVVIDPAHTAWNVVKAIFSNPQ